METPAYPKSRHAASVKSGLIVRAKADRGSQFTLHTGFIGLNTRPELHSPLTPPGRPPSYHPRHGKSSQRSWLAHEVGGCWLLIMFMWPALALLPSISCSVCRNNDAFDQLKTDGSDIQTDTLVVRSRSRNRPVLELLRYYTLQQCWRDVKTRLDPSSKSTKPSDPCTVTLPPIEWLQGPRRVFFLPFIQCLRFLQRSVRVD